MSVPKGFDAYSHLLRLDEFEVVHLDEEPDQSLCRFTIVPRMMRVGLCPHCGTPSDELHQTRTRTIRDLPIGAARTELIVRVPQFRCMPCASLFTPRFQAIAEGTHATERFLQRVADLIRCSDIANAAAFFGIPERTLERWYYDFLERKPSGNATSRKPIRSLGIDELSLKKTMDRQRARNP